MELSNKELKQIWEDKIVPNLIMTRFDCMEWVGSYSKEGYGQIQIARSKRTTKRSTVPVRKICILSESGYDYIEGRVSNTCGNKRCCNPKHLEFITKQTKVDKMFLAVSKKDIQKVETQSITRHGSGMSSWIDKLVGVI